MEWLVTLIPIALIVLGCGAMHLFMMRGGHSGHSGVAGHHGAHAQSSAQDPQARIAHLERQVDGLQRALRAARLNGAGGGAEGDRARVASLPRRRDDGREQHDMEGDATR